MKSGYRKGAWSQEEDAVLKKLVGTYGEGHWSKIARLLNEERGFEGLKEGRIGKQCRERWLHHLHPGIRSDPWTEQEALLLVAAHARLGNRFSAIASCLPGRTENNCKNFWNATRRCKVPDTKARAIVKAYVHTLELREQGPHQGSPAALDHTAGHTKERPHQGPTTPPTSNHSKEKPLQGPSAALSHIAGQPSHKQRLQPDTDKPLFGRSCSSGSSGSCSDLETLHSDAQQHVKPAASPQSYSSSQSDLHPACVPPAPASSTDTRAPAQQHWQQQPQPQSTFLAALHQQLTQIQQQQVQQHTLSLALACMAPCLPPPCFPPPYTTQHIATPMAPQPLPHLQSAPPFPPFPFPMHGMAQPTSFPCTAAAPLCSLHLRNMTGHANNASTASVQQQHSPCQSSELKASTGLTVPDPVPASEDDDKEAAGILLALRSKP